MVQKKPAQKAPKKLRVGWFSLTCSEDNTIVFVEALNRNYFDWKGKVDFVYCKPLKSGNRMAKMDVAFVEGAVASPEEEKRLKEIRENAGYLIAAGACACTGMPSGQRNLFTPEIKALAMPFIREHGLYEKVKAVKDVVKVDGMLFGCPMGGDAFVKAMGDRLREAGLE